jgi:hypothetical protein
MSVPSKPAPCQCAREIIRPAAALLAGALWLSAARADEGLEALADPHFQHGMILIAPDSGHPDVYGHIQGLSGDAPTWRLAQWASRFPLAAAPGTRLPDGALCFDNPGKTVTVSAPGTPGADLSLTVKAGAEYGNHTRQYGENWVHLLLQYNFDAPPAVGDLTHAQLHLEERLLSSKLVRTQGFDQGIHAAILEVVLIVQDLQGFDGKHGPFYWFVVPLYDTRYVIPPGLEAADSGKADATGAFMFQPKGTTFTTNSLVGGAWVTIDKDLQPLFLKGLQEAWQKGYLHASHDPKDYRITSFITGWEVTGSYDVAVQLRNLSFRLTRKGE